VVSSPMQEYNSRHSSNTVIADETWCFPCSPYSKWLSSAQKSQSSPKFRVLVGQPIREKFSFDWQSYRHHRFITASNT
jgi:hypothetical protein